MRRLLPALALGLLCGCPAESDDDDDFGIVHAFPEGDAADLEPNDTPATAQALGVVNRGFTLTGSAVRCGDGGTWEGADVDWFSFAPATGDPMLLRLDMWAGDLDHAVFDGDGELLVDGAVAGVQDEEIELALDPERDWFLRVRCWRGNPEALWRLRLL